MSSPTGSRLRIGDTERDAATAALGEHFASGRLTREEFDERLEQAWAAKTAEELDPLFADLPRDRAAAQPSRAQAVGFHDRGRSVGRWRGPSGPPPLLFLVLAVALVITILTHLPFVLMILGFLWVTGMIRHRGPVRRGHWAHSR